MFATAKVEFQLFNRPNPGRVDFRNTGLLPLASLDETRPGFLFNMAMSYREKLKDPRWQRKRLKILERDEWKCQMCDDNESTLNVHHITYASVDPWDIDDDLLITLCESCHQEETDTIFDSQKQLINALKNAGCMSFQFTKLTEACSSLSPSFFKFPPNIDILFNVINDPELWKQLQDNHFKTLSEKYRPKQK